MEWDDIGSDFWNPGQSPGEQPAPADPHGPGSPLWNRVVEVYQNALGRAPENDQVIEQWIAGTGGDFAKIQQGIYATPEAQEYSVAQQKKGAAAAKPADTPDPGGNAGAPPEPNNPSAPTLNNLLDPFTRKVTDYAPGGPGGTGDGISKTVDYAPGYGPGGAPPAGFIDPLPYLPKAPGLDLPPAVDLTHPPVDLSRAPVNLIASPANYGPGLGAEKPPAFAFPDFAYQDFAAPTGDQVEAEPGYAFGLKTGNQQITNNKAAEGLLRSGATLKDFIGYGNDYATGRYSDTWNRMFNTWGANRSNAFGNWGANRANQLDAYNTNWGVTKDVNADQLTRAEATNADQFARASATNADQLTRGNLVNADQFARGEATNSSNLARAQATLAPSMTAWQTMVPAIQRQSEDNWDRAFQTWGKDFDIFRWNAEWPYQVLSDQQRIGLQASM